MRTYKARETCRVGWRDKIRYRSPAAARKASRTSAYERLYVYACPMCGGWHLTKNAQRSDAA